MSAPWANGITHVGQSFEGGATEFRNVLRKYAVECGFRFKYVKNDSVRIIAVCTMRESKGHMWSIHARGLHADEFFYIRKWNTECSCGVAIRTPKNLRAGSDLGSDVISELVHDKPLTRPSDVVYDLKKVYGLEISYRVAWLDVKKAKGEMFGAHSISFNQLRWYSNFVMENNPGSYINIDYNDQNHRFERYFISFKACIDGFNHCRPLLFLDGYLLEGEIQRHLASCYFKGWQSRGDRYGEMCSNAAESFNSWIREARHLPITQMVDSIRTKIMDQMSKRQRKWQIKQFPYAHGLVAIRNSRRDLNDLVEPYYHVSKYRSTYASSITPIPTVEKPPFNTEDFIIHPPVVKRPLGRPKKK
ncbi:uncharacterized protein LOC114259743 [Camellia sinensis]|uniref:uncharacterized protein LOC114259743 n=1 Tax=Camellia sinensis TaxID=4442 RepID=UPI001036DED3|nr:uncharacterized protein LOC114259743 [Camellia sinensis]